MGSIVTRAGFGLLVVWLAAGPALADPDVLPSKGLGSSTVRCCPEGGPEDARCLEVLVRDPKADKASACALVAGMKALGGPSGAQNCLVGGVSSIDRSYMGIPTGQMRSHGWYQDGPPKEMQGATLFPADMVAAGSMACLAPDGAKPGEMEAYQKACAQRGGYESVHLYLSIAHDVSDDMAGAASSVDPWWKSKTYKDRVFLVESEKREDIQKMAADLLKECKVVSYMYVSSHGSSGSIAWGKNGKIGSETIGSFLRTALTPCLFSPGAQLQFDGCSMGCGTGAEAVKLGLNHIFDGPDYRAYGSRFPNADPFDGLAVYLNTALGYNDVPGSFLRFFGAKAKMWSKNGVGVVLSRADGSFSSDVPTDKVDACTKEGQPLNPWQYDLVSRGR